VTQLPDAADVLLIESTYGGRTHPQSKIGGEIEANDLAHLPTGWAGDYPALRWNNPDAIKLNQPITTELPNEPIHVDSPLAVM
jgi:hypothetical protein